MPLPQVPHEPVPGPPQAHTSGPTKPRHTKPAAATTTPATSTSTPNAAAAAVLAATSSPLSDTLTSSTSEHLYMGYIDLPVDASNSDLRAVDYLVRCAADGRADPSQASMQYTSSSWYDPVGCLELRLSTPLAKKVKAADVAEGKVFDYRSYLQVDGGQRVLALQLDFGAQRFCAALHNAVSKGAVCASYVLSSPLGSLLLQQPEELDESLEPNCPPYARAALAKGTAVHAYRNVAGTGHRQAESYGMRVYLQLRRSVLAASTAAVQELAAWEEEGQEGQGKKGKGRGKEKGAVGGAGGAGSNAAAAGFCAGCWGDRAARWCV